MREGFSMSVDDDAQTENDKGADGSGADGSVDGASSVPTASSAPTGDGAPASRGEAGAAGPLPDGGAPDRGPDPSSGLDGLDSEMNAHTVRRTARRRRRTIIAVILVVILVVVSGVAVLAVRGLHSGGASAASTVTIGLKLAPTNLDIRTQSGSSLDQLLIGNVYEGLVARDSNNKVVPSLAKSWSMSSDGLRYDFTLNSGMTFSNGDVLDADDVVWSIRQLVKNQYVGADLLVGFQSIRALDSHHVRITLSRPYSDFLWVLSGRPGLVLDSQSDNDLRVSAVGSGPYKISSFHESSSVTLKENTAYWRGTSPATPTVVIRYFSDDNAALNALKSGDVQVLAPVSQNLVESLSSNPDYTVSVGEGTDKFVLAFNSASAPTSDIRVRRAIRYAIDHKELIASRGGVDRQLGGPIPSLDPGYEDLTDMYPLNRAKAKSLLAEAGYDEDHPLELTLEYANVYGTQLGEQLKSQLATVGIRLTVHVVEFATWLRDVYTNHDYELSLVDHNESHDFYQWADPDYYYGYDNATVKSLYDKAMESRSDSDRDELLARAARIVSRDAPADWLFNYRITTAWAAGVSGFPVNLNQTLMPLSGVKWTGA